MDRVYLGLDIGTTGIKAVVFNRAGQPLGIGLAEYTLETPSPDIVELPAEQYWESTCQAISQALSASAVPSTSVCAVGVTGQAETLVLLDVEGRPLRKAIVWLDNRAAAEAKAMTEHFGDERLFRLSGQNEMLPCWPAPKLLWLRNHEPDVFARLGKVLMVEDYLIWRLTGCHGSCRGLLPSSCYYDIQTGDYAYDVLEFLQLTPEQFPTLRDSGEPAGTVCADSGSPLAPGTLVVCAPIDHVCGNLGSGCSSHEVLSETTGCSLAVCASFPQVVYDEEKRLSTYLGYSRGSFVLLPWAPTAGMLLKHFRDEFGGGVGYDELTQAAAEIQPGSEGLVILPHCAGAVSPVCNPQARGVAYGITLAHKKGHWARAILESVAYLLKDNILALKQMGAAFTELRSLGGASKSPLWLQIKADVLNMPVAVTECEEATALGAAILAAIAAGDFADSNEAIAGMVRVRTRFEPGPDAPRYQELFKEYQKLNDMLLPTFQG